MDADLPLAQAGARPAGSMNKSPIYPSGSPAGTQGWAGFDEDDEEQLAIGTGSSTAANAKRKGKEKARDCWDGIQHLVGLKKKPLTGERTIHINDQARNASSGFATNYVSTSKYNLITFLPKFLFGECRNSILSSSHLNISCVN